jgi:hypothetical protein
MLPDKVVLAAAGPGPSLTNVRDNPSMVIDPKLWEVEHVLCLLDKQRTSATSMPWRRERTSAASTRRRRRVHYNSQHATPSAL